MRHVLIANVNHVTVGAIIRDNDFKIVTFYCIERHVKQLFTVITTGGLSNNPWHLYQKFVEVSLHIDDFTFIAHAQKRQSESL